MIVYIDNDQFLSMTLTDDTGAKVTSATITAQFMDRDTLIGNPITLNAVANVKDANGTDLGAGFKGNIHHSLPLQWGQRLSLKITAQSNGIQGVWYEPVTVERRQ